MTVKKITIVCPVHEANDIRLYKKQAISLINAGYEVSMISKKNSAEISTSPNLNNIELTYKNRFVRLLSIPKIIVIALKEHADVYHIHNPDTLPVGLVLKLFGKKVIYDTHENFRKKILLRKWIPKLIRSVVANSVFYAEKTLSYCFDATIVTQEEQCSDYVRSCLIGNSPLIADNRDIKIEQNDIEQPTKLVYLGGISEDRGLSTMLKLCSLMNNISPTELYLIGPVINSLSSNELLIEVNKNDNVFYEGVLNQEMAFDLVKNCDYGLILLEDVADYSDTSPNKLFEYMMLSTPFIATDFTKWKALLSGISAGFFISPEGIDFNFANKLINTRNDQKSYQAMSKSGIDFVYQKYNWAISDEPQLLNLYKKVLGT